MFKSTKSSNLSGTDQFALLLASFAILVGLLLRLALPLTVSFPLNDGGLFYAMIRDLQTNHYFLPAFTSYNLAHIPFAYPPLGFYIAAILSHVWSLLDILRLLPAIFSALAIPVFYLIAKELIPNKQIAALAALIFALTPRVYEWHIMGGGITRSVGFLFSLLTIYFTIRLYATHQIRFIFWTSICGALTILSHPEAIPQTVLASALLYIFRDRSRKGLLFSLGVASGVIVLSMPWWLTVLQQHGIAPFIAVLQAAGQDSPSLFERSFFALQFNFTGEPFLPLIGMLALFGTFYSFSKREFFLPVWMLVSYLVEPRGGALDMMLPLTMLAAQSMGAIIFLGVTNSKSGEGLEQALKTKTSKAISLFLIIYLLVAGYAVEFRIYTQASLNAQDVGAMKWAQANTLPNSRFILVTGQQPLLDPTSDWFPALSERQNVAATFGYEWTNDVSFRQRLSNYTSLQDCANQNADCIETWEKQTGLTFDYIYIRTTTQNNLLSPALANNLQDSANYQLVYQNASVMIFTKTQSGN
ncbi:MAG TPA: glycosyltransferase family 39 protein [Anaerolineales bacterium]|nr:glycosyltransferase family 39 protein [Anaerolineales bacterium]